MTTELNYGVIETRYFNKISDTPPLSRRWLVRITANVVTHEGPILTAKVKDIERILSRFVVESGFVACDSDGNVVFSATIPEETHQQIRNVVFSKLRRPLTSVAPGRDHPQAEECRSNTRREHRRQKGRGDIHFVYHDGGLERLQNKLKLASSASSAKPAPPTASNTSSAP